VVFELTPTTGGGWTETVLHNFVANNVDGYYPFASLIFDASGNLYGITSQGGASGVGIVFELTPIGGGNWTETVLHNFSTADAFDPQAGLIFDASGNLYGTTFQGGQNDDGAVFELSPVAGGGWSEKVLHSFAYGGSDGSEPNGGLILDAAGNLYRDYDVWRPQPLWYGV
jgi:uncharacterized repeat protein (TIGR03803 family)